MISTSKSYKNGIWYVPFSYGEDEQKERIYQKSNWDARHGQKTSTGLFFYNWLKLIFKVPINGIVNVIVSCKIKIYLICMYLQHEESE